MKKFMIDSNIFVGSFKGKKNIQKIIDLLLEEKSKNKCLCFTSYNILEEISFVLLKHFSGKGYWYLKNNKEKVRKHTNQIEIYLKF